MRWPWASKQDEEQGDETVERFDDVLDEDEQDQDEGEEQEPELDDETRAYVERQVQAARDAERAAVRTSLQAQGLDLTGDGAAIRDLSTFASRFGFAGQQQEQANVQRPTTDAQPVDPYEALGERPDPIYDADAARAWDQKYRAAIKAEAMAEMAPQLQQIEEMFAQTQVTSALDRVRTIYEKQGAGAAVEHPDFAAEFGQAILKQPMVTWSDPAVLSGIAGWVIGRLKPVEPRQERPRGDDGRYMPNDAQRRSLQQVATPRDAGRPPQEQIPDAEERQMAEIAGMTVAEWRAYGPGTDYEAHKRFQQQQAARSRGRR